MKVHLVGGVESNKKDKESLSLYHCKSNNLVPWANTDLHHQS